ncbi:MAG: hypothetical protein HC913_04320 [Microscillaceae bacterium]|nr:hypothetical protein [Microscillaceae bacterium]
MPGGPVQVYAPGFRNAYDLVLSEAGKLYTWDNSSNANWGVPPIGRLADSLATNISEIDFDNNVDNVQATHYKINDNLTYFDPFHYISHRGYYAGNSNPTRANPAINRFNGLSPVPEGFDFGFWHGTNTKDGLENRFFHSGRAGLPKQNQSLFGVMGSTNGICEYRASNFNQSMKGNILGASFNGILYRVVLNAQGTDIDHSFPHNGSGINGVIHLAEGFGNWNILDVTAQPDEAIFPGTIWIAEYSSNKITVLEPDDFSECAQNNPAMAPGLDFDNDGFSNQDEIDNGTDPCSAASSPEDWDGDLISDLNDSDDDNDGLADVVDAFALDPANGTDTFLPIRYEWEASGSELAGYILNSGFSGLMVNGSSNYKNLYDIDELTVIGTGGLFTIDNSTNGSALGLANNQAYGFQFGLNVGAFPGDYRFHTVVAQPFAGEDPALLSDQNMGIHLGKGNQSNYLKMVVDANNGAGGIRILWEENDIVQHNELYPVNILGTQEVHLYLSVNRQTLEIQPAYSLENGPMMPLGAPLTVPTDWLEGVVATGILASAETGSPMGATWGFFRVLPVPSTAQAHIRIQTGDDLNTDTRTARSFIIENTAPDGQYISQVVLDLSTALLPDLVFDPANAIADQNPALPFTAQEGEAATGLAQVSFAQSPSGDVSNGYRQLILDFTDFAPGERLEFSIDTDPLSLKGSSPENPIGQMAGLELIGTQAIVKFNDGAGFLAPLYRVPAEEAQIQNILKQEAPAALQLRALDEVQTPVATTHPVQTIRLEGRPGAEVQLLVLESGLFVQGVPNNGFEVQPFETNRVLQIVSEQSLVLSVNGTAEVDIQLTRTELPEGETGFHQVVAVEKETDGRTGAFSNVLQFHLLPAPPTASFRINSGGLAYTTTEGAAFEADNYFGTPSSVYNPATGLSIAGTEEDVLYNSERYGHNFAYNFPVDNGNYQVVLHFAEVYFGVAGRGGTNTGLGSRVFNVSLEGQTVLSNFDIFAEAGGAAIALRKSFYVNVNDGNLNVQFNRITDNAKVSAIEIIPAGTNTPPILENPLADRTYPYDPNLENPFSFVVPSNTFSDLQDPSLAYIATQANGQPLPSWLSFDPATATFSGFASQYQVNPNFVDIQVNALDSQGLSASDVFRITFLDPYDYYAVRLNAGKTTGPNVVAQNGYVFANDAYVTGGTIFHTPDLQIAHTEDDVLYQSERFGNMTYNVPVENGAYRVILHFSENYFGLSAAGGIGSRVFHVDLEGQRRLSNYDIFARAGGSARAIREALFVNVSDGLLSIQFSNVNNNAQIAAIEILPFVPTLEESPFSAPALIGANQRPVLKLNIPDTGAQSISALQFSTEGTSQTSDIVRARLLFSGGQNSLHQAVELAALEQPNGAFTLQGLARPWPKEITFSGWCTTCFHRPVRAGRWMPMCWELPAAVAHSAPNLFTLAKEGDHWRSPKQPRASC